MTWLGFGGIFALFFLTHSLPVRPPIKSRLSAVIGKRGFSIAYSALSLCMLSLLIWAAGKAPYVQLWPEMTWHRHVVQMGMLLVCLILAFGIARPNPFSFGDLNNQAFDPVRPGIVRITRHPILLALALWAMLHLLPNGDLAHVLLFGVLGGFAVAGRILIDGRKQREIGREYWQKLRASVAKAPLIQAPLSYFCICLRFMAAIAGFLTLLLLHPAAIGVSAF